MKKINFIYGFLLGALLLYFASYVIYGIFWINILAAVIGGFFGSKIYANYKKEKLRKEFTLEFCDYLDAVASSLSCGKNTYEAFVLASDDMQGLYSPSSPICIESRRVANGLKSGRGIDELLSSMAKRTGSEDVEIFADVYSICNVAGGNLKQIVNDTKSTITEKITIENEINTSLSAPKNELNIMATMPLVITAALRIFGESVASDNTILVNTVAVMIFALSYFMGRKIVDIKV